MKKSLAISYYSLLTIALAFSIGRTIYEGSLRVTHGEQVAHLQQQHNQLLSQKKQLENQIAQEIAFPSIMQLAETQGYVTLTPSLTIKTNSTVASR